MSISTTTREYLNTVPALYQSLTQRALEGSCSPRTAIKAKCLDCCGHVRAEITSCTVVLCPLWWFRPYQTPES
jgi:hypothetical protein